jgi:type IV secretory pathway TrbD component
MLERTSFHKVLYRSPTILSGEREPVLISAVMAMSIAFSGMNLLSVGLGLLIWFGSLPIWRRCAKRDPHLIKIYIRNLRTYTQAYYPHRSRPYREQ